MSHLVVMTLLLSYNSATSLEKPITCGVSQGSVLGPLLFIIYVNDICNTSDIISFCLFADDTSLVYSHKNVNVAVNNLNIELAKKISTWLKANKFCINLLKCNYIIFCTAQKRYNQSVPLVLDGVGLNKLEHTKFLGLEIDEHLSWRNHISEVTIVK